MIYCRSGKIGAANGHNTSLSLSPRVCDTPMIEHAFVSECGHLYRNAFPQQFLIAWKMTDHDWFPHHELGRSGFLCKDVMCFLEQAKNSNKKGDVANNRLNIHIAFQLGISVISMHIKKLNPSFAYFQLLYHYGVTLITPSDRPS